MGIIKDWEDKNVYEMDEKIAFLIFAGIEDQFTRWVDSDKMPTDDKAKAHVKLYATMKSLLNDNAIELWKRYKELVE